MTWVLLILLGVVTGIMSGLFGIGGGIVIVPALVLLFGFQQHTATATSLVALLLPVGILAVYNYYTAGKIAIDHLWMGLALAGGIFVGGFYGSKIAIGLPAETLRKAFAVFLIFVAIQLWFKK